MIKVKNIEVKVQSLDEFFKESLEDAKLIDKGKFKGVKKEISFESVRVLRKFLTPKRIKLVSIIKALKPSSLYELAKITKRPLKSINRDIKVLEELGLVRLKKTKKKLERVAPLVDYDRINIGIEI